MSVWVLPNLSHFPVASEAAIQLQLWEPQNYAIVDNSVIIQKGYKEHNLRSIGRVFFCVSAVLAIHMRVITMLLQQVWCQVFLEHLFPK